MDNQNNTNNNQPVTPPTPRDAVIPVDSTPEAPVAVAPAKISAGEGFKIRMQEIKQSLGLNDPNKVRKILITLGSVFAIIILLFVGYSLLPKQVATPLATLTPTPQSSSVPEGVPSEFADDPEVLRIMDSITDFKEKEEGTILREDDLRLPAVDWNVKF